VSGPTAEPIRVLCVDDEPGFAALVADALAAQGERFVGTAATDASEALDLLSDETDCVVSDYDMPGRDGLELLEAVRTARPNLPFVLFTGEGSESVAADALSAGATDYLQKRGGREQYALLANRVENAVERARASRREDEQRRIGTVVRETNRALAEARTHEEVDQRACEVLADAEPYRLAWVGDPDSAGRLRPRAVAGDDPDYLDETTVAVDDSPLGRGPAGVAFREERLVVSQDLATDERFAPWVDAALDRGYRSVAVVPLVHDDERYGLLAVYADRVRAFGDRERSLLSDLGDTVAHAHRRVDAQHEYTHAYETQYRELFEDAPVLFALTRASDDGATIDGCNRLFAETLGYDRDDLVGRPLATVYDDESATALTGGGYQRALSGEFAREPRTLVAADGTTVETLLRAAPRRAPSGEIVGTHAMYVDVTDDTKLRALERQNERLDRFTSVVSHDLRNPLHVAKGKLSVVRSDHDDPEPLVAADRALDRMDALIDDLLSLARDGRRVRDPRPVDLADLVLDCWAFDVADTDAATLDVETTTRVRADRSRLRQLVANLLSNAVEHGSAGDAVHVTVGDHPGGFFVADDGPGVPASERERVFDSGHSTSDDGTGFGLTIVREIATAHGWQVRATEGAAGGARFEVDGVDRVPE
jgi:PAS domain S-box-containing protein